MANVDNMASLKEIDGTTLLKVLNENKGRICEVFKNTNIIRLYFKFLGVFFYLDDYATDSEIILPEIDRLLSYYDYDCEFKEDGIYHGNEKILWPLGDGTSHKPSLGGTINWKIGENTFDIFNVVEESFSIAFETNFRNFNLLNKREIADLSFYASDQIQYPNTKSDLRLRSVEISKKIQGGCEIMKKVDENYVSLEDGNKIFLISREVRLGREKMVINSTLESNSTFGKELEEYKNEHISEIYYGNNPVWCEEKTSWTSVYNGEKHLNIDSKYEEVSEALLYKNLLDFYKRYPKNVHPINLVARGYDLDKDSNLVINLTKEVLEEVGDYDTKLLDVERWIREWNAFKINKGYKVNKPVLKK